MNLLKLIQICIFLLISIFFSLNVSYSTISQVSAGMNLTMIEDLSLTPSTLEPTLHAVVEASKYPILKHSNISSNSLTYFIEDINSNYTKSLSLRIIPKSNLATSLCTSSFSNFDCEYNYTSTDLTNRNQYTYLLCNEFGVCLGKSKASFLLNQLQESKQIHSGFVLTTANDLSLTPSTLKPTLHAVVEASKYPILKHSNISTNSLTYFIQDINSNYTKNLSLRIIPKSNLATSLCTSSFSNFDCEYNYTSTDLTNRNQYTYLLCNEFGVCLGKSKASFLLNQLQESKQIHAGFVLTMQSQFQSGIPPSYIDPTPYNNSKFISNNITIRVSDDNADWVNITVNGEDYEMINNAIGIFSYYIVPTNKTVYTFQAYSDSYSLEQRTITATPDQTQANFPSTSLVGIIVSLMIIFWRIRKK